MKNPDNFDRRVTSATGAASSVIARVAAKSAERSSALGIRGNSLTPPLAAGGGSDQSKPRNPKENKKLRLMGRRDLVADQLRAASIYWHYAERAGHSEKLPARGVTFCGWTQIAEVPTLLMRIKDEKGHRAFFTGVQTCGLRWVCPCCTAKAAQADRDYVNDGLSAGRSMGLFPVMITLTTRHSIDEDGADVLAGIMQAEQRLKSVKAWRRFSEDCAGYARVLEWTHGKNGHHPHFHTIALMRAVSEEAAIDAAKGLQASYMRQLDAAGRDGTSAAAWERSFQVQGAAAAGGYIAKWGSAEELTGSLAKAGGGEGLTSWQLLRLARTAPLEADRQRYAAIWWEIVCATKGKAQLYKSQGFKAIVEAYREVEDEGKEAEPETVMAFGMREKRGSPTIFWMDALPKRLAIKEAAEAHDQLSLAFAAVSLAIREGPTDRDLVGFDDPDDDVALIES